MKKEVVASGIIGRYNHEWKVEEITDTNSNCKGYRLICGGIVLGTHKTVAKALEELITNFDN